MVRSVAAWLLLSCMGLPLQAESPAATDDQAERIAWGVRPGVTMTLIAQQPAIQTPTGIDVDNEGNIWTISCHTHFRTKEYQGPEKDEVLVFDPEGKRRVFYQKTEATMQILCGNEGWIYLAERDRILRIIDRDGDGQADHEETIADLQTEADYPHNGLSGMTWHPSGELLFALGENFGKDWTLTGVDGAVCRGRGEGGIFRIDREGKGLRRIAKGFWNPFGLTVLKDGTIFAADNDPGARPPCRLLHVVEGGDYGFQWVYGSAPVHPFVAWNGELRGTLGMVHPCGEGPCAVVPLGGGLLIPSWSDHTVDYYPMTREGASYRSERMEVIRGTDRFRPVAMAVSKDSATFYLVDWVSASYEVHGEGRLWKIEFDTVSADWLKPTWDSTDANSSLADGIRERAGEQPLPKMLEMASSPDRFAADAVMQSLFKKSRDWTPETLLAASPEQRLWMLVTLRKGELSDRRWVEALWNDPDPRIQFECLRWIADGVLVDCLPIVESILKQPDLDYSLFEAAIAARNTLQGNPTLGVSDTPQAMRMLEDPDASSQIQRYALRMAAPEHADWTREKLERWVKSEEVGVREEAVRLVALRQRQDEQDLLQAVAMDQQQPVALRAEAAAGLLPTSPGEFQEEQMTLAANRQETLATAALSSLADGSWSPRIGEGIAALGRADGSIGQRAAALLKARSAPASDPTASAKDLLERIDALPGEPDREAGRRLFFHRGTVRCAQCHRMEGRGAVVGPELTGVAQGLAVGDEAWRWKRREEILESILEPSQKVAPQFQASVVALEDGEVFSGILLRSSSTEVFRIADGKERSVPKGTITQRRQSPKSLMPDGLLSGWSDWEVRDLLAYLTEP
ncbi:MAG: PVC-type heme-binding CxxCH protein [Pirellulaceae bacterium]